MTDTQPQAVDYRELMKRVEQLVEAIDSADEASATAPALAERVISEFRDELGIFGGRHYQRFDDGYVLNATFGDAKPVPAGVQVPANYGPIEALLDQRVLYMTPDDPLFDPELEKRLGVGEFAAIVVGDEQDLLSFDVAPGHGGSDILYSLGIVRHSINQKIRQEKMEDVLRQARRIQTSILPRRSPRFGDFDIFGRTEPMEIVGGDFYDYIQLTDKILGVAIADVSGHGLPAALQVRDIFMGLQMGLSRDFKIMRTIERLNAIIHGSTLTSRFVSMFYCELELTGTCIYVNAGHPPPIHLRADGEITTLEKGGAVLGPIADATYERGFVNFRPGDTLLLYTDGIIEANGAEPAGGLEEFGEARLLAAARRNLGGTAKEISEGIFAELARFQGARPAADDRTLVVVKLPAAS